jgi:hypothetical protein
LPQTPFEDEALVVVWEAYCAVTSIVKVGPITSSWYAFGFRRS